MTLDYNDSRIKTKTRVGNKDEISSCNCNNCNNKINYINKSNNNRDYNNKSGNNNRDNNYVYDSNSSKLEFIGVSGDTKYHIGNYKDDINSINKEKDKRNNE